MILENPSNAEETLFSDVGLIKKQDFLFIEENAIKKRMGELIKKSRMKWTRMKHIKIPDSENSRHTLTNYSRSNRVQLKSNGIDGPVLIYLKNF